MPTDRAERRLLDSIRAASEALRAAALDIEEHSEERGGHLSRSRDADQVSAPAHNCAGCAGERDEHGSADAGPTLPPYPPMPPYPPYPPMPPIVILLRLRRYARRCASRWIWIWRRASRWIRIRRRASGWIRQLHARGVARPTCRCGNWCRRIPWGPADNHSASGSSAAVSTSFGGQSPRWRNEFS